jgi:hypothetical protein
MDAFETLISQIDGKVKQLKDHLCLGTESVEGYQRICGEIRGLLLVKEYILDLKHTLEKSNDDSHWLKPQ